MTEVLRPDDLYKLRNTGDAQVSPDGSKVACVISQADRKGDRNSTSIWLVTPTGGKPRRVTNSGKDRFPRWSPDGKRLAFVSDRSGKAQIWVMDSDGGEAWQLATDEIVRGIPVWAPDGKSIAFTARDFTKGPNWAPYPGAPSWDTKRAAQQAERVLSGKTAKDEGEERVSDVKVITRFRYRFDGVGYLGDLRNHIFICNVPEGPGESGDARGTVRRLTAGDFDHDAPAFSPDGRYVAFSAVRRDDADYLQKQDLWIVEVATGRMIQVMEGSGPCGQPAWSPDGKRLAFSGHDGSHRGSTTSALWVLALSELIDAIEDGGDLALPPPFAHSAAVNLTAKMDRPLGNPVSSDVRQSSGSAPFEWLDSETIMFLAGDRGATGLYQVRAVGGPDASYTTVFHDPIRTVADFSRRGGRLVLQIGSPIEPDELYVLEGAKQGPASLTKLTSSNAWLEKYGLGSCERFTYKGDKGWDIDGWLLYPRGYERGSKCPTVLFVHGGPHGVYGSAFMFQTQILASKGYAVLYTNPRGSQSYGQEFAFACVEDWGSGDYRDIQMGVDEVVNRGVADPDRLFITGWSYGGYMTSWTITQTARFKAAVAGAVVADLYSMYGTSDIPAFSEHHTGALPWEGRDKCLDRSAVAFVKNVETPVLFIHGEGDLRCPISQSEEYYLSLKRLGKTAVMCRYPREFHGFTKPSHKYDRFERMIAWFDYYGGNSDRNSST